jgi:glycogen operon protein
MDQTFLGACFLDAKGEVGFRVFAPRATHLELWAYAAPVDAKPVSRTPMILDAQGNYSTTIALQTVVGGLAGTIYYGLRAWGPNWEFDPTWTPGSIAGFATDVDRDGNRFNPNKLLLDPYALEVSHNPLTPSQPNKSAYLSGNNFRTVDTGPFAPKGIVIASPNADFGAKPAGAFKDDIIYEVHLRGLTKNDPAVATALQGTYLGAASRAAYLKSLGVTAVEFQPIHETQNALNDFPEFTNAHNYWGYDPCSYFAADRRYSFDQTPGGPTREWIQMVKAYHAAGLKVYVDMVYNHHNEVGVDSTGTSGMIYSLRGLDNSGYYELASDPSQYQNNNGVGPNINAATSTGRNLVLDSLKHWTHVMGADGFRFDLAAILGNELASGGYSYGRDEAANILNRAVAELPARPAGGGPGVDLIAEPYTDDLQGQEQGNFPVGWSEWNDRFRDTFRAAQNKLGITPVTPGMMATRFAGSDDLFRPRGRKPWNSVNYMVVHDGFTLRDLYSFTAPQNNQPLPFGPSPGGRSASEEMCWDQGGDPVQQRQAARTGLALLLLSVGVPLITGGSEIYRTQFGNNNAFNIDTMANWLDWSSAPGETQFSNFVSLLLNFRLSHPALRPSDFFTGNVTGQSGLKDLTWYQDNGDEVSSAYFSDPSRHFLAFRIDGARQSDPAPSIYVAYNGWRDLVTATLPPPLSGNTWYQVADTSAAALTFGNFHPPGKEVLLRDSTYGVAGRSVLLLIEK